MNKTVFAIATLAALTACTTVDTGNVGIEKSFGRISDRALEPGTYVTLADDVYEVTTKEVNFQVNDLRPKSKDNLTLQDLDVDIYFKVAPDRIRSLYVKYQGDYIRHSDIVQGGNDVGVVGYNRVLRAAREAVYNAISEFDATTMHTRRADISERVRTLLQSELDASDKGTFVVTSINVRNLLTDQAIEEAIRERVRTDQEIARANKEIELENARAQVAKARAQGEADANAILAASLTPELMRIRLAEIERDTIVNSAKAGNTVISGVQPTLTVSGQAR